MSHKQQLAAAYREAGYWETRHNANAVKLESLVRVVPADSPNVVMLSQIVAACFARVSESQTLIKQLENQPVACAAE